MIELDEISHGNCLDIMKLIDDNSVDAIVTDPPYGIKFMNQKWDSDVPSVETWREALRVLKPGGYMLSFAGTRTQHRMACNIEDAGFYLKDIIFWVYGQGFPKSLDIGKNNPEWEGWGTALKPSCEPITVAQKPISEKTIISNVLKWGTGGINIDACRVEIEDNDKEKMLKKIGKDLTINYESYNRPDRIYGKGLGGKVEAPHGKGRFPANLIHDGSDEVVALFPNVRGWTGQNHNNFNPYGGNSLNSSATKRSGYHEGFGDNGSAARFFYCAKPSGKEKELGCEEFEPEIVNDGQKKDIDNAFQRGKTKRKNTHCTIKPIAIMEYLIKLVSKEGAIVLDPFCGSGTTLIACHNLNRRYIGIDLDEKSIRIARARLQEIKSQGLMFR